MKFACIVSVVLFTSAFGMPNVMAKRSISEPKQIQQMAACCQRSCPTEAPVIVLKTFSPGQTARAELHLKAFDNLTQVHQFLHSDKAYLNGYDAEQVN